jgi:hypothetical protein
VSIRQLRARLSRLTPSSTAVIGQDRDRDRRRREELRGRKLSPTGLTELENAEYLKLEALFHEEDRDHDRLSDRTNRTKRPARNGPPFRPMGRTGQATAPR